MRQEPKFTIEARVTELREKGYGDAGRVMTLLNLEYEGAKGFQKLEVSVWKEMVDVVKRYQGQICECKVSLRMSEAKTGDRWFINASLDGLTPPAGDAPRGYEQENRLMAPGPDPVHAPHSGSDQGPSRQIDETPF